MNINSKPVALCAALLLGGCAAQAASMQHTVTYSAQQSAALRPLLAQYDRQIAALRSTLGTPAFGTSTTAVDNAIAGLRSEVSASSAQIQTAISQKADALAARDDAAVSAVLAQASSGGAPSNSDVVKSVQQAYRAQYAELRGGGNRDMQAYQRTLMAQQQREYGTFVQSVQNHTQQAYANRAAQLSESESALLLELARRDMPQRLQIRAKLLTLTFTGAARAKLEAQLAQLQQREDAVVSKQRATDAGVLEAYRGKILAQANGDIATMAAQIQSRTQANLAARRDVLAAQRAQTAANLPLTRSTNTPAAGAAPDLRAQVSALRANDADTFRRDAAATVSSYTQARDDIAAKFASVRANDAADTAATQAAIAQLERDRAALAQRLSK